MHSSRALALGLITSLAACGDPPTTASDPASSPASAPDDGALSASGRIVLLGEPAAAPEASFYVSVLPAGTRIPWISKRILFSDAQPVEGGRSVEFTVDGSNRMLPGSPRPAGQLALKVSYSPSGDALDPDKITSEELPVSGGESGLEIVLDAR